MCDRIAGTIPPYGQHQQFLPLIHSPSPASQDHTAKSTRTDTAPTGEPQPIDWHAAAVRQHRHNRALIHDALGDIFVDSEEQRFISQIAWDGGHLQLASLLCKARQAVPIEPADQVTDPALGTSG